MALIPLETLLTYKKEELLAIRSPAGMFPALPVEVVRIWRKLSSKWHPDKHASEADKKDAGEVFDHITSLKNAAEEQLKAGVWGGQKTRTIETATSTVSFQYLKEELLPGFGKVYTGTTRVWYEIGPDYAGLVETWSENVSRLWKAPTAKMLEDMHLQFSSQMDLSSRLLPDGGRLVDLKKTRDTFCLKHILDLGPLDPRHVTWILTRLYNLACLMEIYKVPNLSLSPESVFVNPALHSLVAFEGWQYAGLLPGKPVAIPARTDKYCPSIRDKKSANISHVLTLIKLLGRECLGDAGGVRLLGNTALPRPLVNWLVSPAGKHAPTELKAWKAARDAAFGKPTWVPWGITGEDIYGGAPSTKL